MKLARTALISLLLVPPSLYAAMPLHVVGRGIELTSCDGGVKALQLCQVAECRTLIFPFAGLSESSGRLDLPSGRWELTIQSSRCWAPATTVDATVSDALPVRPAAAIHGTIEPATEETSGRLRAEFRLTERDDEHDAPWFSEDCQVANAHWNCRAPAAAFDLRLSLEHHAPRYYQSLNIAAGGEKDLGAIRFERGASLAGTIVPGNRHDQTVVELTPESAEPSPSIQKTDSRARRVVVSDSSGLFQFTTVPQGTYRVTATRPGWFAADVKSLQVNEEREYFLNTPLRLSKAAVVDVFLSPPLSMDGEPWLVRLESSAASAPYKPIGESNASFSGEWRNDTLHAGKYDLSVVDRRGSTFLRETVEASIDAPPRFLNILKIHVRGNVKMGTAPFESRLVFTDDEGSAEINLQADTAGRFEGILSHEGRWHVQVLNRTNTFYVKDVSVDVRRTSEQAVATIVVTLPGGKARGRVTNENGEPAEADVIVFRNGRGIADALVLSDGTFEVGGLEPGPVTLQAVTRGAESDMISYLASEDDPGTAELRLQKLVDLKCQLLSDDGIPVAGAVIRYMGAGMARTRQAISAPTGEFSIRVPQGTRSLLAAIVAPGFAASLRPLNPNSSETQRIILSSPSASLHIIHRSDSPWPFVTLDGQAFLPITSLLQLPSGGGLPGLVADGLQLQVAPGLYTVCYSSKGESSCQSANVAAGQQQTLYPEGGKSK